MMSTPSPRRQPVPIAYWLRWAFVLLIPFSAIAFDTWLNTRQINKDYRKAELSARQRQLEQDLNELRANEARLETMDRIEIEAPEIGLRPPEPNQIRTIYYTQSGAVSASDNRTAPLACIREGTAPPGRAMPAPRAAQSGTNKQEESTCTSVPAPHPTSLFEMITRLRQTIAAAYETSFGHS